MSRVGWCGADDGLGNAGPGDPPDCDEAEVCECGVEMEWRECWNCEAGLSDHRPAQVLHPHRSKNEASIAPIHLPMRAQGETYVPRGGALLALWQQSRHLRPLPLHGLRGRKALIETRMPELEFTAEQVRNKLWTAIGKPPRHTQPQLARRLGISAQYLHDILHGRREPGESVLEFLGLEKVVIYRIPKKRSAPNG